MYRLSIHAHIAVRFSKWNIFIRSTEKTSQRSHLSFQKQKLATEGQLMSKRLFFSILPKNEQKISVAVGLGKNLKNQFPFLKELKTSKFPFEIN